MAERRGNTRKEWYDVDILLWGSIVPPVTEDKTLKPWLWDIWGPGPRGQQQQPFMDLGASGLYVRQIWATQIYIQENYTSGVTSGLHGGFHNQVSGLYPESGFNLATKAYVDFQLALLSGIVISGFNATSLSGLNDVSGVWTSGASIAWNGTYFVPTFFAGTSGNWEISGTSAALAAILPSLYQASGLYQVSGTSYTKAESDARYSYSGTAGNTYTAGSGLDLTGFDFNIAAGWGLRASTSGLYVSQSDLSVVFQASGLYQTSGTSYTKAESNARYEASGTSAALSATLPSLYQASGLYQLSGTGYTKAESDSRYQLSGFPAEGSGLYQAGTYYHVGGGWGIVVSDSGVRANASDLDTRYMLSGTSTGSTTLSGLSDVQFLSALVSGHILSWNGSKWTNATQTSSGGSSSSLGELHRKFLPSGETLTVSGRYQVLVHGSYEVDAGGILDIQPSGELVILEDGPTKLIDLYDLSGTFTSGTSLRFDGLSWWPIIPTLSGSSYTKAETDSRYALSGASGGGTTLAVTSGQIYTETLISGGILASSVSGIGFITIPGTYDDLIIRLQMRVSGTVSNGSYLYFNGDTTATDYQTNLKASLSPSTEVIVNTDDSLCIFAPSSSNSPLTGFNLAEIVIPDYANTTKLKLADIKTYDRRNAATLALVAVGHVQWESTDAISGVQIQSVAGNLIYVGSRYEIIGRTKQWVVTSVTGTGVNPALSSLSDVSGIFTSGQVARYDGGKFVPFNLTSNISTSGQIIVADILLSQTLAASQSSFSVSGLAASGYDYIEIDMLGRSDKVSTFDGIFITFNGDTTQANYRTAVQYGGNSTGGTDTDTRICAEIPAASSPAGSFGAWHGIIPAPNSAQWKSIITLDGSRENTNESYSLAYSTQWENTGPIGDFTLSGVSGQFVSGTFCQIRGYKSQWVITSGSLGGIGIKNGLLIP